MPKFVRVIYGRKYCFGIDSEGVIWSFVNQNILSYKEKQKIQKINKNNLFLEMTALSKKGHFKEIQLTKNLLFALNDNGELFSCKLDKLEDKDSSWRKIPNLAKLENISAGNDHILLLLKNGDLLAMGDDTFGQCGQGPQGRVESGPFLPTRLSNPQKIEIDSKISKIYASGNFSYIITDKN